MSTQSEGSSHTRLKLLLDLILFLLFLVALEPGFSGLAWHEWLGIAFAAAIAVLIAAHLGLHWAWIVSTLRTSVWNRRMGAGRRSRSAVVAIGYSAEVHS